MPASGGIATMMSDVKLVEAEIKLTTAISASRQLRHFTFTRCH
jgi:hypothetical protein